MGTLIENESSNKLSAPEILFLQPQDCQFVEQVTTIIVGLVW